MKDDSGYTLWNKVKQRLYCIYLNFALTINLKFKIHNSQSLPFNALKTQAFARKPTPTATNPQPEISLYLNTPRPINSNPISIIINVAHPKTVFLFIPITEVCKFGVANIVKNSVCFKCKLISFKTNI